MNDLSSESQSIKQSVNGNQLFRVDTQHLVASGWLGNRSTSNDTFVGRNWNDFWSPCTKDCQLLCSTSSLTKLIRFYFILLLTNIKSTGSIDHFEVRSSLLPTVSVDSINWISNDRDSKCLRLGYRIPLSTGISRPREQEKTSRESATNTEWITTNFVSTINFSSIDVCV